VQIDVIDPWAETPLVARRCPECGHDDELEVPAAVAEILAEHTAELTVCLRELADRLEHADELWISTPR
jgi:hypothetical protein